MKKIIVVAGVGIFLFISCNLTSPVLYAQPKCKGMKDKKEEAALDKNKELEAQLKEFAAKSKEDKAKLYFELGSAYTKAKLYKNAIDSYLMALEADPSMAEAHYNLGLLYQRYQEDSGKASYHLKQYLNSHPPPDKKKEAQYILKMLNSGREWVAAYY